MEREDILNKYRLESATYSGSYGSFGKYLCFCSGFHPANWFHIPSVFFETSKGFLLCSTPDFSLKRKTHILLSRSRLAVIAEKGLEFT